MAGYFELFDRHFAVSGEEQNIPIVEPHGHCRIKSALPVGPENNGQDVRLMRKDSLIKGRGESNYAVLLFPRMAEKRRRRLVNIIKSQIPT
jgi:hypothetical protein